MDVHTLKKTVTWVLVTLEKDPTTVQHVIKTIRLSDMGVSHAGERPCNCPTRGTNYPANGHGCLSHWRKTSRLPNIWESPHGYLTRTFLYFFTLEKDLNTAPITHEQDHAAIWHGRCHIGERPYDCPSHKNHTTTTWHVFTQEKDLTTNWHGRIREKPCYCPIQHAPSETTPRKRKELD